MEPPDYCDGYHMSPTPTIDPRLLRSPGGGCPNSDTMSTSIYTSLSPLFNNPPPSSQTSQELHQEQAEDPDSEAVHGYPSPSGIDLSFVGGGTFPPEQTLNDTDPAAAGIPGQGPSSPPNVTVTDADDSFLSGSPDGELELLNRLDTIRSAVSTHRLPPSRVREMNRFLSWMLQHLTVPLVPEQPATSPSSPTANPPHGKSSRYRCVLCKSGTIFTTLGSLKRHVGDKHHHRSLFRCYFVSCTWVNPRRDKVHEHVKTRHDRHMVLSREEIDALEKPVPFPQHCEVCTSPADSWESYFRCLSEHCRLTEEQESEENSGAGARPNDDGNGGGSHGFGGGFPPDPSTPGFGGYGSSYGAASGYTFWGGYGNTFTSPGSNSTYQRASACKAATCSLDTDNTIDRVDGSVAKPQSSSGQRQAHETNSSPVAFSSELDKFDLALRPHTSGLPHDGVLPAPHRDQSASKRNRTADSLPSSEAIVSDTPHLPKRQDDDGKRPHRGECDVRPRKCRRCGHIIGSCSKCNPEIQTVDFCHNCQDDFSQQALAKLTSFLANYDPFQAFACNGVPNRTRLRDEIHEVVMSIDRVVSPTLYSLNVTKDSLPRAKVLLKWNASSVENAVSLKRKSAFCDSDRKSPVESESAAMTRWVSSKEVAIWLADRAAQYFFSHVILVPRRQGYIKPGTSAGETMVYPRLEIAFSASSHQMMRETWHKSWEHLVMRDRIILGYWKLLFGKGWVADPSLLDPFKSRMLVDRWLQVAAESRWCSVEAEKLLSVDSKLQEGLSPCLPSVVQWMNGFKFSSEIDAVSLGQRTLEMIRHNPIPTRENAMQYLLHCDVSMDALTAQLSMPGTPGTRNDALRSEDDRHRRLSALRARLRVITTLLILQMSVAAAHQGVGESDNGHSVERGLESQSLASFGTSVSRCMTKYCAWFRTPIDVVTSHAHFLRDFVHDLASFPPLSSLYERPDLGSVSLKSLTMKLCDLVECPITIEQAFLELLSAVTGYPGWEPAYPGRSHSLITSTVNESFRGVLISGH